jgi:transposase-like protein
MTVPAVVKPMKARVKPLLRHHRVGRPTKYKKEFAERAGKLALRGYTDVELAAFFNVCEKTINVWKHKHTEFLQSIRRNKALFDIKVVEALFQLAVGYEHKAIHFASYKGKTKKIPYIKRYPPDTKAAIFWLKHRQPERWQ